MITNIVIISENWWEGRDKDGKIGVFPGMCNDYCFHALLLDFLFI